MDNILTVKSFLDAVPDLQQALAPASSPLLIKIKSLFQPTMYQSVRNLIYETLHEDVMRSKNPLDQRNQRMFAVKVVFLLVKCLPEPLIEMAVSPGSMVCWT